MAEDGPRVIDFGISRAAENHNTLTETGQMIGTPPFMSPEQFTDARDGRPPPRTSSRSAPCWCSPSPAGARSTPTAPI